MTEILQQMPVTVSDRGELVILKIAETSWALEFVTALELAIAIKIACRAAKASAGDYGFRRNCAGVLHDAAADRVKPSRFGRSMPERLAARHISVKNVGQIVQVKIRETAIGIPYHAAAKIAQWLRIHGRLARNAAGERRHWADLARPGAIIQAGA